MILCIGTTPAAQRVMIFRRLAIDEVNRAVTTLDGAAGKSINVAKVLHSLDVPAVATGFLGGPRGEQLHRSLTQRGLSLDFVTVTTPTRECVTVIDQSAGTITELVEESQPVQPPDYDRLLEIVGKHVPRCRAVVMSGTIPSGGPPDFYARCATLAHAVGVLSVADAAGPALLELLATKPGLVKPNRAELAKTVGRDLTDDSSVLEAMRELHTRGARRIVITSGAAPLLAYDGDRFWRITSPKIIPVNPIGSGDAFTATLVWRMTLGEDLGEACRWGAASGAANALTPMAGEVNRPDLDFLLPQVQVQAL